MAGRPNAFVHIVYIDSYVCKTVKCMIVTFTTPCQQKMSFEKKLLKMFLGE